jgi:pathogenesis-related protein 1
MSAATRLFAAFGVALLVAVAAVGAFVGTAGRAGHDAGGLTREQAEEVVRAHNAWRRRIGVSPLRWAPDLATGAQARAEYLATRGCVFEHGPLPEDVGENLFRVGPLQVEGRKDERFAVTATQVVDAWGAESADYSPAGDTCAWNRQCGHYTQIVWATTRDVGCGMSVCPTLGQVWVCRYRPRGNIRMVR